MQLIALLLLALPPHAHNEQTASTKASSTVLDFRDQPKPGFLLMYSRKRSLRDVPLKELQKLPQQPLAGKLVIPSDKHVLVVLYGRREPVDLSFLEKFGKDDVDALMFQAKSVSAEELNRLKCLSENL